MALELKPWGQEFFLLEELGAGGMGMVYLGYHRPNRQLVAIKTLFPEMSSDEAMILRFNREANVYNKLSHPNIVHYIDSGVAEDKHYIALEFVAGTPLDTLLKEQGPGDVRSACEHFEALVEAVGHAHEASIVHRDLKPENIIISLDGVLKLLDFGIAQAEDDNLKTVSGSILGTFFYASPEQNQGKKVDKRSDIYSLGLIFYELLTGKRAISGGDLMAVTLLQVKGQLPRASENRDGLSNEFDQIIEKCCARDPKDRYADCQALLVDLCAVMSDNRVMSGGGMGSDVNAKFEKAKEAMARKDFDSALKLALEVSEKVTDNPDVHCMLGKIYQERKLTSQALEEFKKAVKLAPKDASYRISLAIALWNMKMRDQAKKTFKDVLKTDPTNVYARNYLTKIKQFEDKKKKSPPKKPPPKGG